MAILRKIKERIKKLAPKRAAAVPKKIKVIKVTKAPKVPKARVAKGAPAKPEHKDAVMGTQEVVVGKTKFSTPEKAKEFRRPIHDLPGAYGSDQIVLQVRDPWWLHTYWEVTSRTLDKLRDELRHEFFGAKMIVRAYDVSNINFNGSNAHRSFDTEVGFHSSSWYLDTSAPGRSWCADIGLLLASGKFIMIARSNVVNTPIDGPSWITDEEWMIPDEMFARLYGMGFGFGKSSPVGKAWQERMRKALFSGILASPGMASMTSPTKKAPRARKFWFWVNTELIVYGATEPDAKVTVQGQEIKLRPDGTFTLRYALPDGKQVIPCTAESSDKVEERTITPIVSRETKRLALAREKARPV